MRVLGYFSCNNLCYKGELNPVQSYEMSVVLNDHNDETHHVTIYFTDFNLVFFFK